MSKEILMFGDVKTEKKNYRHKSPISYRMQILRKYQYLTGSSGEKSSKFFIGYLYNDHKVKPLYIMLPKTSAFVKRYDEQTKQMQFLIENYASLKNVILFGIKSRLI